MVGWNRELMSKLLLGCPPDLAWSDAVGTVRYHAGNTLSSQMKDAALEFSEGQVYCVINFYPVSLCTLCEWQLHKLYNICSIVNYEFILMYTIITLLYGPITCHIILSHYDRKLWPGENRGFTNILWSVNNWHKDHTNVYWPSDVSMGLSYVTISE